MATSNPEEVLKLRLARGEISIEEYKALLLTLDITGASELDLQSSKQNSIEARGEHLASVDNTDVFEHEIIHNGNSYSGNEIVSVRSGVERSSFNGVPASKHTWVKIVFSNGSEIKLEEKSTWRRKQRHEAIIGVILAVKRASFEIRINQLVERIKRVGSVPLTKKWLLNKNPIKIYSDGSIGDAKKRYDIKNALNNGTLKIGITRASVSGSQYTDPNEISISDRKTSGLLATSLFHGISFVPTAEDPDIVMALVQWLSKPGNHIGG